VSVCGRFSVPIFVFDVLFDGRIDVKFTTQKRKQNPAKMDAEDEYARKEFLSVICFFGTIFCFAGCFLVMYTVTAVLAEGDFIGFLIGAIACFVMSVCCCLMGLCPIFRTSYA